MSNTAELKRIARFALFGSIGFGAGMLTWVRIIELPGEDLLFRMLAFPISGALGGAALGLAFWNWRRVIPLALLGAIGFMAGSSAGGFISLVVESEVVGLGTWGAITGAVLGLQHRGLVLAFGRWWKIIGLAIAGALGFGIGAMIASLINDQPLDPWLGFVLIGIIGGACLGAALGYLEKGEPANQSTPSPATP